MKAYERILISVSAVIFFVSMAFPQTNPNLEVGFKPYGSYDSSPIDTVTVTNGNLALHIPLFEYPQRGGLRAPVRLIYNSKGWRVHFYCTQLSCLAQWDWQWNPPAPLGVQLQSDPGVTGALLSTSKGAGGTVYIFTALTADGASHQLAQDSLGGYRSIDATGFYFNDQIGIAHV